VKARTRYAGSAQTPGTAGPHPPRSHPGGHRPALLRGADLDRPSWSGVVRRGFSLRRRRSAMPRRG